MNIPALLVFVPTILSGGLLAHLLWPDRSAYGIVLKASLGIGLGLGARSVLYFVYLMFFAGMSWFPAIELILLMLLMGLTLWRESRRRTGTAGPELRPRFGATTWALGALAALVFVVSLLATANYLLRRRQGDWDAWMMYNRAAKFVYLDQSHWLESFSQQMDPIFHPDYPLLLAMNIAAGWQNLGRTSSGIPMIQSGLFAVGCAGLMVGSLGWLRTSGQAALGLIILWGIPTFVNEGARQMADVPLAFYVLATGALLFTYVQDRRAGLLVLAGLSAGFAAWTKNEGMVLVAGASIAVLVILRRREAMKSFVSYIGGLIVPLGIVVYFKTQIAPPGDILSGGAARLTTQAADISRHLEILRYFGGEVVHFGSWDFAPLAIGILPILLLYWLFFRSSIRGTERAAFLASSIILGVQLAGYYAAFLITPYDLTWHLSYSTDRLMLQVFPLLLFLILCASIPAEQVVGSKLAPATGAQHASHN
jgi:Dolichyl-phosphate-mannose-protein mannosyltransferase